MIYEFECEECKNESEIERSMKDESPVQCPICKSWQMKQLISRTTFVLSGDGWARDGYAKKW